MSSDKRTFPGAFWKRLLPGTLALIFYGWSVLAFGSMMEEPSVSVFLSGDYPEKNRAEEILKTLEQTEAETSACFCWDGGMTTLTEPDYGRSAEVMAAGILGDGSLYDKRIHGFWEKDKEGCVIDGETAWKLFGTREAEGRWLIYGGKNYQVRQVLPWKQRMILIRPEKETDMYTRVFLKNESLQDSKTAEQFLMAYGLNGTVVDSDFLISAARILLLIFPVIVSAILFMKANRERKQCREEKIGCWLWTGACILMMAAVAALIWKNIEIPQGWIPSRWSDFKFWSGKYRELEEQVRLFLMLPKTVLQAENISGFVKCAGCSVGAVVMGIVQLR